jgi:hypothetical protein
MLGQYAKSGDIIFDVAGGGLGGSVVGKVAGRAYFKDLDI